MRSMCEGGRGTASLATISSHVHVYIHPFIVSSTHTKMGLDMKTIKYIKLFKKLTNLHET